MRQSEIKEIYILQQSNEQLQMRVEYLQKRERELMEQAKK